VSEVLFGWWKGVGDGAVDFGRNGVLVGVLSEVFGKRLSVGFILSPAETSGQKTEQTARRYGRKDVEVG